MSPSSSLCIAALWAATWATPPAPMMSTLRLVMSLLSTQARPEVLVAEAADDVDRPVQPTDRDRRLRQPVEPRRLDHRVAGCIGEADLVADLRRRGQAVLAEDVTGQARTPGDHGAVLTGRAGGAGE